MKIIKSLLLLTFLLLLGFGCGSGQYDGAYYESPEQDAVEGSDLKETIYTTFVINVHDWVNPELSIATLNHIIDLHEEYGLPVDIYLDDQVVQIYEEQAPNLIERLGNSQYVAVSYHVRPPTPYYGDFDWFGLDNLNDEELMSVLNNYEEHKIDLSTGDVLDEEGGYQHVKNIIGYPPYIVGSAGNTNEMKQIMSTIYKEKGASFIAVKHGDSSGFGEKQDGLWLRPENIEVKVYEPRGHKSGESFLTEAQEEVDDLETAFVNLKWHENNFYTWQTPWAEVYFTDQTKEQALEPPFDLSKAGSGSEMKTEEERAEQWSRYEECLSYAKDHPESFTVINAKDLMGMVE